MCNGRAEDPAVRSVRSSPKLQLLVGGERSVTMQIIRPKPPSSLCMCHTIQFSSCSVFLGRLWRGEAGFTPSKAPQMLVEK